MRAFSFPFRMCVTKQQPHQPATTTAAASIAIISRNFPSKPRGEQKSVDSKKYS
jgi:hypothetical protein